MGALGYLYWKTFRNRVKMALRKPITYFYAVLLLFYFFALPKSLRGLAESMGGDSEQGFVIVMTGFAIWAIPANLIAYARRKGLLYKPCDVHFLFPAPFSPKRVLVYAHLRTLAVQVLLNLFIIVCGKMIFHAEMWKLAVYFFFSILIENLMEGCLMLLLYGSERIGERERGLVVKAAYGLSGALILLGFYACLCNGMSLQTVADYLLGDGIRMVPLIGWYLSMLHLLFLGPTAVSVAGTACYLLLLAAVVTAARRMACKGDFYEDAMKFAEDYEEVMESRRQGNALKMLGRKPKFGRARVRWRGTGARALFYRQLLEYKKSKFFIFDGNTVAAVLGGAALAYLGFHEGGFGGLEEARDFAFPIAAAYLIFILTSLNGKWAKELKSPYTYLLPDTVFRKLINATAIQHVQDLVNACLLILPGALVMETRPLLAALAIAFYVVFAANKVYAYAVAEIVCGSALGRMGKQWMQMLLQGFAAGAAVLGGALGMATGGVVWAYVLMDVFLALFTAIFMVIAALNFYHMEAG